MTKLENIDLTLYDAEINDLGNLICPHCNCYLILRNPTGDPDYWMFRCSCCERDFRMKNKADKDFKFEFESRNGILTERMKKFLREAKY